MERHDVDRTVNDRNILFILEKVKVRVKVGIRDEQKLAKSAKVSGTSLRNSLWQSEQTRVLKIKERYMTCDLSPSSDPLFKQLENIGPIWMWRLGTDVSSLLL